MTDEPMTTAEVAERAASHWNAVTARTPTRTRWWLVPEIVRHVNRRVCGEPLDGFGAGLRRWVHESVSDLPLERGIAIGAGNGAKEMDLIADGIVAEVDVFEIAGARVAQGRTLAADRGLADRITFHERLLDPDEDIGPYDLVHWNNALHHMLDVDQWLAWSRRVLRPGGVLVMDDFVGPDRFQWPRRQLRYATRYRRTLPKSMLADPHRPGAFVKRKVTRPTVEEMIASDPTEAADSSAILGALRRHFPEVEIRFTGGVIYQLALTDIVANMDSVRDEALLKQAMYLDDLISELGENHYAVAIARVPTRRERVDAAARRCRRAIGRPVRAGRAGLRRARRAARRLRSPARRAR